MEEKHNPTTCGHDRRREIGQDFNEILCSAIEETIYEALGADALASILITLREKYDVSRDELPYRIESLYEVLENSFNVYGAKTIVSDIARNFYSALGLEFQVHDGYSLSDYLKQAKKETATPERLAKRNSRQD